MKKLDEAEVTRSDAAAQGEVKGAPDRSGRRTDAIRRLCIGDMLERSTHGRRPNRSERARRSSQQTFSATRRPCCASGKTSGAIDETQPHDENIGFRHWHEDHFRQAAATTDVPASCELRRLAWGCIRAQQAKIAAQKQKAKLDATTLSETAAVTRITARTLESGDAVLRTEHDDANWAECITQLFEAPWKCKDRHQAHRLHEAMCIYNQDLFRVSIDKLAEMTDWIKKRGMARP